MGNVKERLGTPPCPADQAHSQMVGEGREGCWVVQLRLEFREKGMKDAMQSNRWVSLLVFFRVTPLRLPFDTNVTEPN